MPALGDQSGSVSIIFLAYASMAVLLIYGIVAVAEHLVFQKEMMYGTQASANAGAYQFGRSYLEELNICIKEKILEGESLETEAESDSEEEVAEGEEKTVHGCSPAKIKACAESDFKECEVKLSECWEEDKSPIIACQEDEEVKAKAFDVAKGSAKDLADKYDLEKVGVTLQDDSIKVKSERQLETHVPKYGKDQLFKSEARSEVKIKAQE